MCGIACLKSGYLDAFLFSEPIFLARSAASNRQDLFLNPLPSLGEAKGFLLAFPGEGCLILNYSLEHQLVF